MVRSLIQATKDHEIDQAKEVAFVTGASSGIGRAVAVRLAARGAAVGLFSRSEAGLTETAQLVRDAGGTSLVLVGDVTDEPAVSAAVRRTVEQLGPLRTTVACAGVIALGTVPEMKIADWHEVIGVNLTGCSSRPAMRSRRWSRPAGARSWG